MSQHLTPVKFAVCQLGARMHYAVPRILYEHNYLARLFTDICATKSWPRLLKVLPTKAYPNAIRRLIGRNPVGIPPELITDFPAFGLEYFLRLNRLRRLNRRLEAILWAGERFAKLVRGNVKSEQINGIYAFNTEALEILQCLGGDVASAVEQTIAPKSIEAQILEECSDRYPDWMTPADLPLQLLRKLGAREEAEWDAADQIICGSEFVRDGIQSAGGPAEKCEIVPYGVDLPNSNPSFDYLVRRPTSRLRVLVVGRIGIRKGAPIIHDVAKATKAFTDTRIVGPVELPPTAMSRLSEVATLIGTVPRHEVRQHYDWADVFLLPSFCEGSATVTYEAMSYGLPVICTPNTGSLVAHGRTGFIVNAFCVDSIVGHLLDLSRNTDMLCDMSTAAMAFSGGSIDAYATRLVETLT